MGTNIDRFVIGVDPGQHQSGMAVWRFGEWQRIEIIENHTLWMLLQNHDWHAFSVLVIERIVGSYSPQKGGYVGRSICETCEWIGRFDCGWQTDRIVYLTRQEIKARLTGSARASDRDVTQAILDRYGGSRKTAVGTKAKPGPLYKFRPSADAWQAMAVVLAYMEQ